MATYEDKMQDLSVMTDEDLAALEAEITSAFEQADQADDLDGMSAAADALDAVRGVKASRGQTDEAAPSDVPVEGAAPELTPEAAPVAADGNPFAKKKVEDLNASDVVPAADTPTDADSELIDESPAEEATETPEEEAAEDADNPLKKKKNPFVASGDEPEAAPKAEAEGKETDAAVTASADNEAKEAAVEIPEDRMPVETASPAVTITAGADIPGMQHGSTFSSKEQVADAMVARLGTFRGVRGGDGEQLIVATVASAVPEERRLDSKDPNGNKEKIERVTSLDPNVQGGIIASGGFCAPLEVRYDIFGLGVTSRPVRDSLAGFQADRGGIRFIQPPVLQSMAGAVGIWSAAEDANAVNGFTVTNKALTANVATITTSAPHGLVTGQVVKVSGVGAPFDGTYTVASTPTSTTFTYARTNADVASAAASGTTQQVKALLKVACSPEQTALVDAITLQLQFGNLMGRAFPELVSRNNELALVWQARVAEQALLSKISAFSTAATSAFKLGTARDFLEAVGRGAAAYRARQRLDENTPLRVIAPAWVQDAMREDLTWSLPGDQLEWADSVISGFLSARNVNVTWHLDDASFTAAQGAGALAPWPTSFKWQIFAEGTFLFLDGGTLDLGIVRDSTLVSTNDYTMFVETFEGLAKVGTESVEVTTTTHVSGAASATVVTG